MYFKNDNSSSTTGARQAQDRHTTSERPAHEQTQVWGSRNCMCSKECTLPYKLCAKRTSFARQPYEQRMRTVESNTITIRLLYDKLTTATRWQYQQRMRIMESNTITIRLLYDKLTATRWQYWPVNQSFAQRLASNLLWSHILDTPRLMYALHVVIIWLVTLTNNDVIRSDVL